MESPGRGAIRPPAADLRVIAPVAFAIFLTLDLLAFPESD